MDRLDAIKVFVRVVESGSFSAVARELRVGQPAISKQVAALEAHLGAQLLRRTSRSSSLTEAGRDFYESAVHLLGELEAAESRIGRGQVSPSGLLRVTVAPAFGRVCIVPQLPLFFARYPELRVELLVTERFTNLVEDGIDLAIRHGELGDSSLVSRKLGTTAVVAVASPKYLKRSGEPLRPADLDQHQCLTFVADGKQLPWRFDGHVTYQPRGNFRTNDGEDLRAAALAGLGIAQAPAWLFERDLAARTVRRVLRDYEPGELAITAVRPAGRRLTSKVSLFIEFVAELFAKPKRARIHS
jgi:LysR family transcriptional regulator for bpeEF and oprC